MKQNPIILFFFIAAFMLSSSIFPYPSSITKTASPKSLIIGDTVTFTIDYSNVSASQITGYSIWDTVPYEVTPLDAGGGALALGVLSWDLGSLDVSAGGSLTWSGIVASYPFPSGYDLPNIAMDSGGAASTDSAVIATPSTSPTPEPTLQYLACSSNPPCSTPVLPVTNVPMQVDIDVTYIERIPKFNRYYLDPAYFNTYPQGLAVGFIMPDPSNPGVPGPDNWKNQGWPPENSTVTYIAHVRNKGRLAITRFSYRWVIDGVPDAWQMWTGAIGRNDQPYSLATRSMTWHMLQRHTITFETQPLAGEITAWNNSRTIGSHDLTIVYLVEKGFYDWFNVLPTYPLGPFDPHNPADSELQDNAAAPSYSFEDWIQKQYEAMNRSFAKSIYASPVSGCAVPIAPDGIYMRVRLDDIEIGPCFKSPYYTFPETVKYDGIWTLTDAATYNNSCGYCGTCDGAQPGVVTVPGGAYQAGALAFTGLTPTDYGINWGIIHETAHQMGIIDLYQLNLDESKPDGGMAALTGIHGAIDYHDTTPGHGGTVFSTAGDFMGGGDISPYPGNLHVFAFETAGALNREYNPVTGIYSRRGYFGIYLYDQPDETYIQVVDLYGSPINGVNVKLYQKGGPSYPANVSKIFPAAPIQPAALTANILGMDGMVHVLDQLVPTTGEQNTITPGSMNYTTPWGHTLNPNPFGQIDVVGRNSSILAVMDKGGRQAYGWLLANDSNAAYYSGCTDTYVKQMVFSPVCCDVSWTVTGGSSGVFNSATGAAVDPARSLVYVADDTRILKIGYDGSGQGVINGFNRVFCLDMGMDGYLYAGEYNGGTVKKIDPATGVTAETIGSGVVGNVRAIDTDDNGDIYICTQAGKAFRIKLNHPPACGAPFYSVIQLAFAGDPLSLITPTGIQKAGDMLYISDTGNSRLTQYRNVPGTDTYEFVRVAVTQGYAPGQAYGMFGITRDLAGNFYLASNADAHMVVYNPDFKFAYDCRNPAAFLNPYALAVDPAGNIYMASGSKFTKVNGGCLDEPVYYTPTYTATCDPNSPTISPTQTMSATLTMSVTQTMTPTHTPTATDTNTPEPTFTATEQDTPSMTETPSTTAAITATLTATMTMTPTAAQQAGPCVRDGQMLLFPNPATRGYVNMRPGGCGTLNIKVQVFTTGLRKIKETVYENVPEDGVVTITLTDSRGKRIGSGLYCVVAYETPAGQPGATPVRHTGKMVVLAEF